MNKKIEVQGEKMTFSIKEAADLTGLSVPYLYVLSAKGELPVLKVGTRCLILRNDLENWLRSKRRS